MLEILIGLYAGICWLLIKKFKLIPWTFNVKVIVYIIPIIGSTALILSLNFYCPITSDVRVFNRSVDITSQVMGKIKKVYVKTNQEVKKGDTLFMIDQEPFLQEVKSIEAKLSNLRALVSSYDSDIESAKNNITSLQNQLNLANKRVEQYTKLVNLGAANKFDLEQAQTNAIDLRQKINIANAQLASLKTKVTADYEGENASVSELLAKLDQVKWNLSQTVILAPTDGYIPNVQINEGAIISAFRSAFVLIQKQQTIVGLFSQNEVQAIKPNDEVEIALRTKPGKIIKAKLNYVIDATSQGIMNNAAGMMGTTAGLPNTARAYPEIEGKLIASFEIEDSEPLTIGARGSAVVYSEHIKPLHMVRKVMIRIGSKMNYIIPKLH